MVYDNSQWKRQYQYRIRHPKRYMFLGAKYRAKRDNLEFNITEEDIEIPEVCPILGIPLEMKFGEGKTNSSPSLDRIDNNKGYLKGNVQVVSWRANYLKSNGTLGEFRSLVRWLEDGEEKKLS